MKNYIQITYLIWLKVNSLLKKLLSQTHNGLWPPLTWFLKIAFLSITLVCMCVFPLKAIINN